MMVTGMSVLAARKTPRSVDPTSKEAIGERLLLTRKALGYTTTLMCRLMGSETTGSAYSNYEMARRRIALDHALALCQNCALTLDWIYRGDASKLPEHLQEKIQQLRAAGVSGPRAPRPH